jgi:hypothetical protein
VNPELDSIFRLIVNHLAAWAGLYASDSKARFEVRTDGFLRWPNHFLQLFDANCSLSVWHRDKNHVATCQSQANIPVK